jgi:hypothetical protein
MDAEITFNREWEQLINATGRSLKPAVQQGLRRAGASALERIDKRWVPGGGVPPWKAYSAYYAQQKGGGQAAPGRQVSHSTIPDLVLTGALKIAALYAPDTAWPNYHTLVLWPRRSVQRGKQPVGKYADAVYALRPFYGMTTADESVVAEQFVIGFMNVLHGLPDPVGRHLGA